MMLTSTGADSARNRPTRSTSSSRRFVNAATVFAGVPSDRNTARTIRRSSSASSNGSTSSITGSAATAALTRSADSARSASLRPFFSSRIACAHASSNSSPARWCRRAAATVPHGFNSRATHTSPLLQTITRHRDIPATRVNLNILNTITDATPRPLSQRQEDMHAPARERPLAQHRILAVAIDPSLRPIREHAVNDAVVQVDTAQPVAEHNPEPDPDLRPALLIEPHPPPRIPHIQVSARQVQRNLRHLPPASTLHPPHPPHTLTHARRHPRTPRTIRTLPTRIRAEPSRSPLPHRHRDLPSTLFARHAPSIQHALRKE